MFCSRLQLMKQGGSCVGGLLAPEEGGLACLPALQCATSGLLPEPSPSPLAAYACCVCALVRYGESEGLLSKVFKAAEALGGAIVFFDELDALGGNRERGDLHEASRRMLR